MTAARTTSRAQLLAAFLSGAWRVAPPESSVKADELALIAPLLLGSGAGALGWRRIQGSGLSATAAAKELQEAYRLHALHALLFKERIRKALRMLRDAGVEPILIKGWANARLYTEAGLRPYGDVDLAVSPADYATARELVLGDGIEGRECLVDLHRALDHLDGRKWEEFYTRSRVVKLDEIDVRILSAEDHLHILCFHMLEDGAWRPIQLCDIGALVEAAGADFDWDVCLGKDVRRARWVACGIILAHELLGARIDDCPAELRRAKLPRWLVPAVLRHWERPRIEEHRPPELIAKTLRKPFELPRAALRRWPDPIGATIRLKGSFNSVPRLPFQLCDYFIKNGKFLMRLPKLVRARQ